MSNCSIHTSNAKYHRYVFGVAIMIVQLLAITGCKIPPLQCADPAPVLPQRYNWFSHGNKIVFGTDGELKPIQNAQPSDSFKIGPDGMDTDAPSTDIPPTDPNTDSNGTPNPDDDVSGLGEGATNAIYVANLRSLADRTEATAASLEVETKQTEQDAPPLDYEPLCPIDTTDDSNDAITEANLSNISASRLGDNASGLIDEAISMENSAQLGWREFFNDPYLTSLIDQAMVGNQELKILAQEIRIACLEVQARSGEYRPFVNLGAGVGWDKSSRFSRNGAVEDGLQVAPGREFPDPLPDFLVATNFSWELDIWRKLRNAQSAAAMRFLGTRDGQNYVVTRLIAELAEDYYKLLALDNRLATLDKTIEIQEASLKMAEAKKQAGRGTELAVQRFKAEVRKNQSEKLIIVQEIIEVENGINLTVGRFPEAIKRPSLEFLDMQTQMLSVGVPSQQLLNRADIRQAEREVQATGLDVQVARARFYPSLTLRGGLGLNAFSTGYLLKTPESMIYNLAGDLVGPLINKRAIKAAYLTANASQLQAIYDYQRTVLVAHIEVVNEMTKVENYEKSIQIKKEQLNALEASVDSATKLFQSGRAEYVEVLLAQREMMEAKMILIETKQQQLSAIVNAYQALGGGSLTVSGDGALVNNN